MQIAPTDELGFWREFQRGVSLQPRMRRLEMFQAPVRHGETVVHGIAQKLDSRTVAVYARHNSECPRKGNPYWRKCRCIKYLYIYSNGASRQISARTRSWEKAEKRAQDIRESFDPARHLQREPEAGTSTHGGGIEIAQATDEFMKEIERLNREEATRKKYKLTLARLSIWCAAQSPPVFLLSQLDVPTLRRWVLSWHGAPTTRHNQHQRLIAFFYFCTGQGWIKENPAKRIKNVPAEQDETLPFTREQYEALLEATYYYDSRGKERNGDTTNSRRVRAYLKLLRWSGLRAGDAACLAKSKLRDDDSLFLYQAKVKGKASAAVYVLLPPDIAEELRSVPPSSVTDPNHFFWSGRSKRKSEVSNWEKIFARVLSTATEKYPKLFLERSGQRKPAHLHMLRDTFAVEYLLAGMSLEEVSRLLGHSSVLITQKHYAPWVLQRQQRLAASQRAAWATMGIQEQDAPR
jgi:integrase/recombinase XerD